MPIQAPQWTEFLSCPVCCNEFAANLRPPISLGCGHTICRTCLATLHRKQCPFDQTTITTDLDNLPVNNALLQLVSTSNTAGSSPGSGSGTTGSSLVSSTGGNGSPGGTSSGSGSNSSIDPDLSSPSVQNLCPDDLQCYKTARGCIEELALYLKPYPNGNAGGLLSRPMQRKLVTLVNCQLIEDEGRARSLRAARSLGERTVTELILQHQNPQQLSTNLWAAVRARGCQFLGPAMQEEVLKLVLLALEDGSALSRKVLVMFVVQRLEPHFPQASKTSIGHVVQLLYRASCFKVSKREGDSSLMQLKEEFRTYEALRREHDAQIVQIATEAGLRIAPDQWSSLLYGDTAHKSHMQSIIDKLQTPQSFVQSVQELIIALQRTGDPANLSGLRMHLKHLAGIDSNAENHVPTWRECSTALESVKRVVIGLVEFVQHHGNRKLQEPGHLAHNSKYKISLCRDLNLRGTCPRGPNCTFAHSEEELEKYRTKLRTKNIRTPNGKDHGSSGEYMGDLGMPSGSHGYHSSGEEASPMRYPKSTPPIRFLDKSPMSSHSHASGSSNSNSNSSHNSHLAPIPPHQHPSFGNAPPQASPLQQHSTNGRSFNFNPNYTTGGSGNMSYAARPPPPSMQPPPPPVHSSGAVRGNFIRPLNGNYLGHPPPPPPSMQHNPGNAPMNHPTYTGVSGGQPPPLDQMHPGQMMNAPPPPYVGNQGFPEYSDKIEQQRRQFNPWENQPPPPAPAPPPSISNPNGGAPQHLNLVPPNNVMGGPSKSAGMNPSYPPSLMAGKGGHMPPSSMGSHSLPPLPTAQSQLPPQPHHPHQQHPPAHAVGGNSGKLFPGNGPLHHHQRRDFREKHHNTAHSTNNNGRLHIPHGHPQAVPPMHHQQQQHQQLQQPPAFGNGTRSNLHTPLPQAPPLITSNIGGNGMVNGCHGGTGGTLSFSRSEAFELYKMIAGTSKDIFVRSDSLLADDDIVVPENDYPNATSTTSKYGPISRMNNPIGIGAKPRGDFPFSNNLVDSDWLLSMQNHIYNDITSLGEQSSSNCSSNSSSFYQLSQQQQQHPVSSSAQTKHEPNNNTLELDLFNQVDRKMADYNNSVLSGDNSTNATSQLLHHHQVEAQLLLHQQQQQQAQQQQHHTHHSMSTVPAAPALMSSHHHHQQQQIASTVHSHHSSPQPHHHQSHHQQPPQHNPYAQQQQQHHALSSHKLHSNLGDAMRFGDLMGSGPGAEMKIHGLKDMKAQQTMTGLSPVSAVLPTSGVSSSVPLWNDLLELSVLKPDSSCDLINSSGSNGVGSLSINTTTSASIGSGSNNNNNLNSSTASSSISNIHNNSNSEDSYEAGIADGMRELELRLESDLGLDENGA